MSLIVLLYRDIPFTQEYHVGYRISDNLADNDVRRIAVDSSQNIWIATANGIFVKLKDAKEWKPIQDKAMRGPSFDVAVDAAGNIWFSTWNGIFKYNKGTVEKIEEIVPPVSIIAAAKDGIYFFGYYGVWQFNDNKVHKINLTISKGIRDAACDAKGNLWLASDVGLYQYKDDKLKLFQENNDLISAYVRGVAVSDEQNIWAGGLGGVTIRNEEHKVSTIKPENGLSTAEVNCVRKSPSGVMWVGSNLGIVRYYKDGSHSLRFSRRWLMDDRVRGIAFDKTGTAWIATAKGVSAIKTRKMTLAQKEQFFYSKLMRDHVREPWIIHRLALETAGDTTTRRHDDDDNDGEYTAIYLSMESLRYAASGEKDAREKAKKAFHTLKYFQEVTGTDGFFARTIIPIDWNKMHDGNHQYTEKEIADERVKNPRYKIVAKRWHKSADGKWLWKGDTSSDEMCGHFMGYYYYYEFAADEKEKEIIRMHVKKIMDYLIKNNFNFLDVDGKPTLWAVWSPDKLNNDPDWAPEKRLNSFELLAYLKFAYHITNDEKYQQAYKDLINKHGYLKNISKLNNKNPAWEIYFDVPMAGYLFSILVKYEEDAEVRKFYEDLMDEWFEKQKDAHNALNNFIYCYARNKREEVQNSIDFLIDTPLDLVDWHIDHTKREDICIVRKPILEDRQTSILVPASERATVRWDKNPWLAVSGNPHQEREPVFWLFPYWMAKYLQIIQN